MLVGLANLVYNEVSTAHSLLLLGRHKREALSDERTRHLDVLSKRSCVIK